jgi:lipoprotein-anchoring transpeptidase ErfK/SrfK
VKAALLIVIAAASLTAAACGTAASTGSGVPAPADSTAAVNPNPAQASTAASAAAAAVARALDEAAVPAAAPARIAAADVCASNTAAQFVLVEISQQHAWMCEHSTLVYDTPVTTGEVANGDDTPTGTWHIQSKQGARYLTTLDGTRYHVDYWLPYDDIYGFHDAAWQTFPEGSDLYKTAGSHGCVHLPETAMAWLSGWANVGATVTIRT